MCSIGHYKIVHINIFNHLNTTDYFGCACSNAIENGRLVMETEGAKLFKERFKDLDLLLAEEVIKLHKDKFNFFFISTKWEDYHIFVLQSRLTKNIFSPELLKQSLKHLHFFAHQLKREETNFHLNAVSTLLDPERSQQIRAIFKDQPLYNLILYEFGAEGG